MSNVHHACNESVAGIARAIDSVQSLYESTAYMVDSRYSAYLRSGSKVILENLAALSDPQKCALALDTLQHLYPPYHSQLIGMTEGQRSPHVQSANSAITDVLAEISRQVVNNTYKESATSIFYTIPLNQLPNEIFERLSDRSKARHQEHAPNSETIMGSSESAPLVLKIDVTYFSSISRGALTNTTLESLIMQHVPDAELLLKREVINSAQPREKEPYLYVLATPPQLQTVIDTVINHCGEEGIQIPQTISRQAKSQLAQTPNAFGLHTPSREGVTKQMGDISPSSPGQMS